MVSFTHAPAGPCRPGGVAPASNGGSALAEVTIHAGPAPPGYLVVPQCSPIPVRSGLRCHGLRLAAKSGHIAHSHEEHIS